MASNQPQPPACISPLFCPALNAGPNSLSLLLLHHQMEKKHGSLAKKSPPPKKRSGMSILRAALLFIRRRPAKPTSVPVEVIETAGKGLKNLVGAVRPLHLQQGPDSLTSGPAPVCGPLRIDSFHDGVPPPPSPPAGFVSDDDDAGSSRYASAQDLRKLDDTGEEGEEMDGGDEAIDVRAEEFIRRFYESMRIQRMDSLNRYTEMID